MCRWGLWMFSDGNCHHEKAWSVAWLDRMKCQSGSDRRGSPAPSSLQARIADWDYRAQQQRPDHGRRPASWSNYMNQPGYPFKYTVVIHKYRVLIERRSLKWMTSLRGREVWHERRHASVRLKIEVSAYECLNKPHHLHWVTRVDQHLVWCRIT